MIKDGILMWRRFSIGWNFHPSRNIKTVALPLAVTFAKGDEGGGRWIVTFGPITFVWLLDE